MEDPFLSVSFVVNIWTDPGHDSHRQRQPCRRRRKNDRVSTLPATAQFSVAVATPDRAARAGSPAGQGLLSRQYPEASARSRRAQQGSAVSCDSPSPDAPATAATEIAAYLPVKARLLPVVPGS